MKNTAPDKPPCLCDVCGVDMRNPETDDEIGISFEISNSKEADRVAATFGKANFSICFVCWLKALGVKKND